MLINTIQPSSNKTKKESDNEYINKIGNRYTQESRIRRKNYIEYCIENNYTPSSTIINYNVDRDYKIYQNNCKKLNNYYKKRNIKYNR
jgi:hypothetical protein